MAFFEFNIALSGLHASKQGLQVTSNNITNASTKGYSRQVLNQKASTPLSGVGIGMTGTGVSTTGIERLRNSYLDTKLWTQNSKLGEYNVKVTQNSIVESVFGEPNDSGFTTVFNNVFSSMNTLSTDPSSNETKIALREAAISFTNYYNNIASSLSNYQQDLNTEFKAMVEEINAIGERIQSLNNQIFQAEIYGDDANSFRDERDLCIDRLSELVNVEAYEQEVDVKGNLVKQYVVKIAGQTFVDHLNLNTLELSVRGEKEELLNSYSQEFAAYNKLVSELNDLKIKDDGSQDSLDRIAAKEAEIAEQGQKINDNEWIKKLEAQGAVVNFEDGKYIIKYEGNDVVFPSGKMNPLEFDKKNSCDVDGLYDISWSNGAKFDMSGNNMSGELKGIIDMRDGCGTSQGTTNSSVTYNGIPYYISRMDEYVRTFAQSMNEAYSSDAEGYIEVTGLEDAGIDFIKKDSKGNITYYKVVDGQKQEVTSLTDAEKEKYATSYEPKYQLFAYSDGSTAANPEADPDLTGNYSKMTAANFSISAEVYASASNIRTTYDETNPSDGSFMLHLSSQKDNGDMFKEGDPKDYMISIFSELGINAEEAQMYQSTQTSVTNTITNQRLAVSQVDTSEEFAYLIQYQQAYQAAAKIMSTIDGIYETTIFKLGNF